MERTIERMTADLQHAGIDPNGYGQRIGESPEDFRRRTVYAGYTYLEYIIAEDIRNNWPHCAAENRSSLDNCTKERSLVMRRLFVIVPLWLLTMTLGLIGWNWLKHQPPPVDLYLSDLQAQCDSLGTVNSMLLDRVRILETHVYGAGL